MTDWSLREVGVRVKFLRDAAGIYGAGEPAHATEHSAGVDLRACFAEKRVSIAAGERFAVPSGLAIEIVNPGLAGFVFSRSGLGAKDGLTVAQGVGVIDPDYRGEITIFLLNTSKETLTVERGQRVAQLLVLPYVRGVFEVMDELGDTTRGAGGFGHTGTK